MNALRWFSRPAGKLRLCACLAGLLTVFLISPASAQELMPAPKQAFTPNAALIIYADLQAASRSGIWKTLESKLAPLAEQFSALPGMPVATPDRIDGLPGIEAEDMAEMAIVIAGRNALQNLESGQYDSDFAFTVVGRLARPVDTDDLIHQVLEAIETQQSGLRARIEPTRARVGVAEFFDLPAELLGPATVPFPVSAAVGQGADGTVFGFGKSDSLRAFVTGQTDGMLPAGIAGNLARRGQIWVYLPLHEAMLKTLADGADADNPMVAGLAQGMGQVKELGLGFSFGSKKLDVELALGCTDTAAARELTENLQQFIGLMQMMSAQNPGAAPPFLGKLRAASDGAAFRLTTELTARDFDLALQSVSPGSPSPSRRSPGSASLPPVVVPEARPDPVTVEILELLPGDMQSLRHTRLQIDNRADQPVRDIRLTFHYFDHAGQRVGQWTRRHMDPVADTLVAAGSSREIRCPIFHVPLRTRRVTAVLHEVTFADGSKWTASR